ncbi:restriction endonuclease subunit S [Vibrio campbellii]|uniref:restriction endonuclease subunit S n=1 Tax=Vibrio campbellii TaxID=680 RepID=UPI002F3E34A5
MSKQYFKKGLPQLRFLEFKDGPEWSQKKLSDPKVAIFVKEKGKVSSLTLDTYISTENILPDYQGVVTASKLPPSGSFTLYKNNDVLISNIRPYLKKVWHADKVGAASNDILVIRAGSDVKSLYLLYLLKNDNFIDYMMSSAKGVKMPRGDIESIRNYPVFVPEREEQTKIAGCLPSLDDVITTNNKKLDSLKLHKKGLLQKLFPDEGKSVPELGFTCNVKWNKKTFEEVYSLKTTNSLSRDKLNYDEGLVKNIHYGDIHTKFSTLFDITKESVPFINAEIALDKVKEESYCQEGDMVFADASEDIDDVGKSIELINLNGEKLLSGLHTILARQKGSYLVKGFGGYLFKSEVLRKQIQKESQGAKVLGISATRISKIDVVYPIEQSEQQRIVDCLSSLDKLIDTQTKKIEILNIYKKGLMQQLFPEIKEAIA